MIRKIIFFYFLFVTSVWAADVVETLVEEKEKLSQTDEQSRAVMATLYDINLKMKRMSRRRDILNNRLISVQGNVATLEASTQQLSQMIDLQRRLLSKRLRAMYMIGDEGVVRALFSSSSSHELDKLMKYLRRFSNQDYRVIKSYEKNLSLLKKKKTALDSELQKLAQLRTKIKDQETVLDGSQKSKTKLLTQLEENRKKTIHKIKGLRAKAESILGEDQLLRTSFFEKKGELPWPANAHVAREYGLIENSKYRYRLAHKGVELQTTVGQEVKAVDSGVVRFIGHIEGYGTTLVLDHKDHFYTVYSNLADISLREQHTVVREQVIAQAAGPLYFEVRHFSDALDPAQWLQSRKSLK